MRISSFILLRLSLLPCCLLVSHLIFAQNTNTIRKQGDEYFRTGRFKDAIIQYSQYQLEKPGDLDVLTRLATSYYELRDLTKAIEYFEFLLSTGARNAKPEAFYFLARSYHLMEKWTEAIKYYKMYLGMAPQKHEYRPAAIEDIRRCSFAREHKASDLFSVVQALANDVNGPYDELSPVPSINHQNRVFFSSARQESSGGPRMPDGTFDDVLGKYTHDIFYADQKQDGTYTLGQLPEHINTFQHEQLLDFAPSGKIIYYFRGNDLYSGEIFADTIGSQGKYPRASPHSVMMPTQGDADLFIAHDSMIFFASRRAGGYGGLDLYYAIKSGDGWQEPVNLGSQINSAFDDRSPFLSYDGNTLYFASNRPESIGGLDIFCVPYDNLKKDWTKVTNLGSPINSASDDTHFRITSGGKTAWFASNRPGGQGGYDIYQAWLKKAAHEGNTRRHPSFLGTKSALATSEMRTFQPLIYTNDRDVLSPANVHTLKEIASIAQANTNGVIIVTCHTEEAATPILDAFVGIKRARIVSAKLTELGIPANRITTRSAGSGYPAALSVLGETQNDLARKYNHRITVEIVNLSTRSYIVKNEPITVPDIMKAGGQQQYLNSNEGITYRVHFLNTTQMYSDDILGMFPDVQIEYSANGNADQYSYTVGMYKEVTPAVQVANDLKANGFQLARIVPYLFGKEITHEEAKVLKSYYPDLTKYLQVKH